MPAQYDSPIPSLANNRGRRNSSTRRPVSRVMITDSVRVQPWL